MHQETVHALVHASTQKCISRLHSRRARLHWRWGQPIGLSGDEFTPPGPAELELRGGQFALRICSFLSLSSPFFSSPFFIPRTGSFFFDPFLLSFLPSSSFFHAFSIWRLVLNIYIYISRDHVEHSKIGDSFEEVRVKHDRLCIYDRLDMFAMSCASLFLSFFKCN